jgi:hypothetical protein
MHLERQTGYRPRVHLGAQEEAGESIRDRAAPAPTLEARARIPIERKARSGSATPLCASRT